MNTIKEAISSGKISPVDFENIVGKTVFSDPVPFIKADKVEKRTVRTLSGKTKPFREIMLILPFGYDNSGMELPKFDVIYPGDVLKASADISCAAFTDPPHVVYWNNSLVKPGKPRIIDDVHHFEFG